MPVMWPNRPTPPTSNPNQPTHHTTPPTHVAHPVARYVDQGGGKRKGAFAMYCEPWHPDIFDFM